MGCWTKEAIQRSLLPTPGLHNAGVGERGEIIVCKQKLFLYPILKKMTHYRLGAAFSILSEEASDYKEKNRNHGGSIHASRLKATCVWIMPQKCKCKIILLSSESTVFHFKTVIFVIL